jgi:transcription elongation GreA/GreB family factor
MVPGRKALIARCRQALELRRTDYVRELASLDEAASRETKSSAGDKYETGREMIAQGRNLILRNLAETDAHLESLERMAAFPVSETVTMGSLVETSQGWYLVGVSLGEVDWQGTVIRTLTLGSPLGLALRGRAEGDRIAWRGKDLAVLRIVA